MLRTLNIENIAVIEKAEIDFVNSLNVLTGETGAGKSIIIDSINAIIGERISRDFIRNGAEYACVTAFFDDVNENVISILNEFDIEIDDDKSLLISRKITTQGKSICKINGVKVTVSMLKKIGTQLINIHGQHDSQALLNPDLHYTFIDMFLDDENLLKEYKDAFHDLLVIRRKLKEVTKNEDENDKIVDLLDYQINEIESANVIIGERQKLNQKKTIIENSENLLNLLNNLLSCLNGDDEHNGISSTISIAENNLSKYSNVSDNVKLITDKLYEVSESLEVIKDITENEISNLDIDENERENIENRLDLLFDLTQKYGSNEEEILSFLDNAKKKRQEISFNDEELETLNLKYDECFDKVLMLAENLSQKRKEVALKFENDIKIILEFLNMPKIKFKVDFQKGNLTSNGFDKIEFLISTNAGESLKPLSKVASGGELSRVMLAIKNVIADKDTIDTLIFDEIDTGVSGGSSRKIGLKLKSLSKNTQVITVTHSAQIASVADEHFLINKRFIDNKTYTNVTPLDFEGRKHEIARIMGGLDITDTLLKSAEELLLSKEDI